MLSCAQVKVSAFQGHRDHAQATPFLLHACISSRKLPSLSPSLPLSLYMCVHLYVQRDFLICGTTALSFLSCQHTNWRGGQRNRHCKKKEKIYKEKSLTLRNLMVPGDLCAFYSRAGCFRDSFLGPPSNIPPKQCLRYFFYINSQIISLVWICWLTIFYFVIIIIFLLLLIYNTIRLLLKPSF